MKTILCEACGSTCLEKNDNGYVCKSCGALWQADTMTVATRLSNILDEFKQEQLAHARNNLYKATHQEFLNNAEILKWVSAVEQYNPDDFLATFYKIAIGNDHSKTNEFLSSLDTAKYKDYLDIVLPFLFKVMERENLLSVGNLIERAYDKTDPKYLEIQSEFESCAEKISGELYDVTSPRDVFVAYKSEDMGKVTELVQYLEDNGLACFVSARNLRHGKDAVGSYDDKLKTAIDNCRVVVFVSSNKSRTTGDARYKELPYIRQKDIDNAPAEYRALGDYTKIPAMYKKGRVEYLIEPYKGYANERFIEQFFDGLNWATTPQMVYNAIDDMFNRTVSQVNQHEIKPQRKQPKVKHSYPTLADYAKSDFIIFDTILKKYIGSDDEVEIPQGVTDIILVQCPLSPG